MWSPRRTMEFSERPDLLLCKLRAIRREVIPGCEKVKISEEEEVWLFKGPIPKRMKKWQGQPVKQMQMSRDWQMRISNSPKSLVLFKQSLSPAIWTYRISSRWHQLAFSREFLNVRWLAKTRPNWCMVNRVMSSQLASSTPHSSHPMSGLNPKERRCNRWWPTSSSLPPKSTWGTWAPSSTPKDRRDSISKKSSRICNDTDHPMNEEFSFPNQT